LGHVPASATREAMTARNRLAFDDDHVEVLVLESDKKLFRH
jgi:hypothetical protein